LSVELVSSARSTAPVEPEDAAIARIVTRLSSEYVLRAFQLLIDVFGDIRAGLLVQVINTANIAALIHTDEGRSAAGPSGTFPDEVRRPISIARLADSAGLPFESTRRIVRKLIDAGHCRRVEGGVIVPRATFERPAIVRAVSANVGYVRRFTRDLRAVGLDEARVTAGSHAPTGADADAAAARIVSVLSPVYILRALQLLADAYGDIRAGIVAQTIVTANTAHLDAPRGEGWRYAGIAETPPDEVRRPISVARLAESLGLPYETMRQQVRRLIDAGVCVRLDDGLIVPGAVLERPASARSALANVAYVQKFMRDLHAAGFDGSPRPELAAATCLKRPSAESA
jgi:DNA-binding Lrp family transcriptional regulator